MRCVSHRSTQLTALTLTGLLAFATFSTGCATHGQNGLLIGSGLGALGGQAIGGDTESTLIGTAIGGGLGYVVGNEMDKQQQARNQRHAYNDGYRDSYRDARPARYDPYCR